MVTRNLRILALMLPVFDQILKIASLSRFPENRLMLAWTALGLHSELGHLSSTG